MILYAICWYINANLKYEAFQVVNARSSRGLNYCNDQDAFFEVSFKLKELFQHCIKYFETLPRESTVALLIEGTKVLSLPPP